MSAESASLKIGFTTLKVRNLLPLCYSFKQTDFLRSVSPIFLTLTSQSGNQGIAEGDEQKTSFVFWRFRFLAILHTLFPLSQYYYLNHCFTGISNPVPRI